MTQFGVQIEKNELDELQKQLKAIKKYLQNNLRTNVSAAGSRLVEFAKRITPVGKGEPEGGNDRPRPGTKYGDLRKGWYLVRSDRSLKMAQTISNSADIRHSIGLSHDAYDKPVDSQGQIVLRVLEKGSRKHDITVVNRPWLIYWARNERSLTFRKSVIHPGTEKTELLTRIQKRGELLANVLAGRTEQEIDKLL